MLVMYDLDVPRISIKVAAMPQMPMAMPEIMKKIYSHWKGISGDMLSYRAGYRAAQNVPIPPSTVNPAVSAINTIPTKRRILGNQLLCVMLCSLVK
jgi:hypothetical protein